MTQTHSTHTGMQAQRRFFCTYFDHFYLPRGMALYHSLLRHCPDFQLWVLCLDDNVYEHLAQITSDQLQPIRLADFEQGDHALLKAKTNRSRSEYYFTCTPSLPLYVFQNAPAADLVTYLDSDLFFFADPLPIFNELGDGSIAIIPHHFPHRLRSRERFGHYNVGWVSFRRDPNGLACLEWWRDRCLEWCYDRVEQDRFADQKYLNQWPVRFQRVREITAKGANLAPWNLDNYTITYEGGVHLVDDDPLVFYHFQGLSLVGSALYDTGLWSYFSHPSPVVLEHIYLPYIQALRAAGPHTKVTGLRRTDCLTRIKLLAGLFYLHARLGLLTREYLYTATPDTRILW